MTEGEMAVRFLKQPYFVGAVGTGDTQVAFEQEVVIASALEIWLVMGVPEQNWSSRARIIGERLHGIVRISSDRRFPEKGWRSTKR